MASLKSSGEDLRFPKGLRHFLRGRAKVCVAAASRRGPSRHSEWRIRVFSAVIIATVLYSAVRQPVGGRACRPTDRNSAQYHLVQGSARYHLVRGSGVLFSPIDIFLSTCARLFPPITMLHDVMREYIAPWDKGNKNNNHQDGSDIFCHRRIDLVGGP